MSNEQHKQRSEEPITHDEWSIHERYREVARSYYLGGKVGQEAHSLALENLRSDLQQSGVDPQKLEIEILDGNLGDTIKEVLLHARWYAGEALTEEEDDFHKTHNHLIK